MKIINAIFAQNIGGVEQSFRDYGEALTNLGNEVLYLVSDNKYSDYKANKVFKLKSITPALDCLHILWIFFREKPDIVICHSLRLIRWMKFLKKFTKAKIIAINHGTTYKNSIYCDYVFSVNEQIQSNVLNAGFDADKSFVVANAIKIAQPYIAKSLSKKLTLGMYARYEEAKGFEVLIESLAILQERGVDAVCKIGGFEADPNYNLNKIKSIAKGHGVLQSCKFIGMVKDKKSFFKDVDIFVVPSYEETFGIVILEGFAHSTLVISSTSDGGKLLINSGENGMLFENKNAQDLAHKIAEIANNSKSYNKMTKNAYDVLRDNYSLNKLQQNLDQILGVVSKI